MIRRIQLVVITDNVAMYKLWSYCPTRPLCWNDAGHRGDEIPILLWLTGSWQGKLRHQRTWPKYRRQLNLTFENLRKGDPKVLLELSIGDW